MSTKRMSAEEKKLAILEIFAKAKTFFRIQELERIGSREKGIREQTIKEVVTSLLDDDLISGDKIGTSTYYWGNENKKKHSRMVECRKVEEEIKNLEESLIRIRGEIEEEVKAKPPSEERLALERELREVQRVVEEQGGLLKGYTKLSIEEIEEIKKDLKQSINGINKLTDDIFMIQSYVCGKFNMDKKEFNNSFGVSNEMDYV